GARIFEVLRADPQRAGHGKGLGAELADFRWTPVVIVEPRFEDLYLSNTHNPIISTTSWLLPAVINNMPPTPIIRVANTGSFNFFVLREVELSLGYCTWEKGCFGDLCGGQCVDTSTCPSTSRPRKAA
ncbi:hypothetical protein FOZ62_011943, partial [Perkinsus olseni]